MLKVACPNCSSQNTTEILYGMPSASDIEYLQKKIDKKQIVLGGCEIIGSGPTHYCFQCDTNFDSGKPVRYVSSIRKPLFRRKDKRGFEIL
jgi:hypothetical protein